MLAKQTEIEQERQKEAEKKNEEQRKQEAVEIEKLINSKSLSIFDTAIGSFYSIMQNLSKDTGDRLYTDFSGAPNVHNSSFTADGKIVTGTNVIHLGTNSSWHFELTAQQIPGPSGRPLFRIKQHASPLLTIRVQVTNSVTSITIRPIASSRFDRTMWEVVVGEVLITLYDSSGKREERRPSFTDFPKAIEAALRSFLAAHDELFPLSPVGN